MRLQFLYFPFDAATVARIDPATPIQVTDGPPTNPDWMHLQFKVSDPATPLPLCPIFSGQMFFLPDPPTATRTVPPIDFPFQLTAVEYAGWQTVGRIGVTLDPLMMRELRKIAGLPGLFANRVWIWPVRLPQGLAYGPVRDPANANPMFSHSDIRPVVGAKIAKGAMAVWQNAAVASFLSGDYAPRLKWHNTDPARDGLAQPTLPVVDPAADGTVDIRIATALALEDASVADGSFGVVSLAGAYIAGGLLGPESDVNASIRAREFLGAVRSQMLGAEAPNALADAMFPAAAPPTVAAHFSLLGTQENLSTDSGRYVCGMMRDASMKVRNAAGNLLQDRHIPLHGEVSVALPRAASELPLTLEFTSASLEVTAAPGGVLAGPWTLPAVATTEPLRFTIAPPVAQEAKLRTVALDLSRSTSTREITRTLLEAYDTQLRPAGWPPATIPTDYGPPRHTPIPASFVFVGTREPWNDLSDWELGQIMQAVRSITGVPPGLPVRVADALLLWAMEGKIVATTTLILPVVAVSQARNMLKLRSLSPFDLKTGPDYDAAAVTPSKIATLVRVWALWNLFGLDDFNHHAGGNDNQPSFDAATPIPTLVADHDTAFNTARARITAAGLNPPDLATVNGAFSARKVGSGAATDWEFRCADNCIEIMIKLQYCEYLRRMLLLPANVAGTANDAAGVPFDVRAFPAFGYMAFNGGITVSRTNQMIDPTKRVFVQWAQANADIGTATCVAVNPQDALRCRKVSAQEIQWMVNSQNRRASSRLNGIQYAALIASYGRVFPIRL